MVAALLLLLVNVSASFGQNDKMLITGKFRIDGGTNSGARIVLEKNGQKVKTIDGTSRFEIELDYQAVYVISFEKDGYVTKKLRFDTHVPASRTEAGFLPFDFTVEIFQQFDDVNVVVFNQPVGKIAYSQLIDEFDYDTDYTKSIQTQIEQVMKEVEEKKVEQAEEIAAQQKAEAELVKQVSSLTSAADKSAAGGNYEAAINNLQEAAKLQDSPAIQQKIAENQKKLQEQQAQKQKQEQFNKLLADAEAAMAAGDLDDAKKLFTQANGVIEGDPKVKAQLDKVNQQIEQQAKQEQEAANLIKAAQDALAAKNWPEAVAKAEAARKLKPDPGLDKIIADANAAIEKEKADKAAADKLEADYAKLLTQGDGARDKKDFANAKASYEQAKALKPGAEIDERIAAINKAQAEAEQAQKAEAEKKKQFDDLLAQAESALQAGELDDARQKAQLAAGVMQDDRLKAFETKLKAAEDAKAKEAAAAQKHNEEYDKLIAAGNAALATNDLDGAKTNFDKAKAMLPARSDADAGLAEVAKKKDEIAAKEKAEAEKAAANKAEMDRLLADASDRIAAGDFPGARKSLEAATALGGDPRIAELNKAIADKEKAAADAKAAYDKLVKQGDDLLAAGTVDKAQTAFEEAKKLDPARPEAEAGLQKVAKQREEQAAKAANAAAEAEKQKAFAAAMDKGSAALKANKFDEARTAFKEASTLNPGTEAQEALTAVDAAEKKYQDDLLAQQSKAEQEKAAADAAAEQKRLEEIDNAFKAKMAEGDKALKSGKLPEAKTAYEQALAIKPGDATAQAKIAEVDGAVAAAEQRSSEEAAAAAAEKAAKEQEAAAAKQAETEAKEAKEAKEAALAEEAKAKAKAEEEAAKAAAEQAEKDRLAAEQAAADKAAAEKAQNDAKAAEKEKAAREEALAKEREAAEKAAKELAEREAEAAKSAQEQEKRFNELMAKADEAYAAGEWQDAQDAYSGALGIKDDPKASQRVNEIMDKLEAERQAQAESQSKSANEANALKLEEEGDKLAKSNKLPEALAKYKEAQAMARTDARAAKIAKLEETIAKRRAEKLAAEEAARALAEKQSHNQETEEIANIILDEGSKQNTANEGPKVTQQPTQPAPKETTTAKPVIESDERPVNKSGGAVQLSEVRTGDDAMRTRSAALTEEDKYDGILNQLDKQQAQMVAEEEQRVLKEKYPARKTVETTTEGNSVITYIYINQGDFVHVYKKVVHSWGGVYYFVDQRATNQRFWEHETQ